MPALFEPLKIREVTLRNRVVVSPMCQYSSQDGFASDWHLVHLGSRAVGGAGLVFTEATAVEARGRISPEDLGLWKDEHVPMLQRITAFIESQGAFAGVQLAHAGRKASTATPWKGGAPLGAKQGGWEPIVGPSPLAFDQGYAVPEPLTPQGIQDITAAFTKAAERALSAGFKVIEIHGAHGYLISEFLSPVANQRADAYGGSFEKTRIRLLREVVGAVRKVWPERLPLFTRLSVTDWLESGGWDMDQSVALAKILKADGEVDLIDCSSGGNAPQAKIPIGAGLPDRLCRAHPQRGRHPHRRRRHDHLGRAGGNDPPNRPGRPGPSSPAVPARPLFRAPRRPRPPRHSPRPRPIRPRQLANQKYSA